MNAKAPNCPTQNPIEDIWLQAKTWIRRFCALLPSWAHLTWMFEWFIRNTPFDFASLQMYGVFSKIKYDSYIIKLTSVMRMQYKNLLIISISLIIGLFLGLIFQKYYGVGQLFEKVGFHSVIKNLYGQLLETLQLDTLNREEVDCHQIQSDKLMVALVFGQSNSANEGEKPKTTKINVFSFYKGKCYKAKDPLLGASGEGGSVWTRLGDKIIDQKLYNQVLFVPIGVGGTEIGRWKSDGDLHQRILNSIKDLKKQNFTITHMLWHQGEADAGLGTSKKEYKNMFLDMLRSIRTQGVDAPIYVSVATLCGTVKENKNIQQAQRELVNISQKIYPGPNTDQLGLNYRFDGCHFSDEGLEKHAELWLEKLKIIY